jgi:hypothetical protein
MKTSWQTETGQLTLHWSEVGSAFHSIRLWLKRLLPLKAAIYRPFRTSRATAPSVDPPGSSQPSLATVLSPKSRFLGRDNCAWSQS